MLMALVQSIVIVLISPMFLLLSFDVVLHRIVGESPNEFMEITIMPERVTPECIFDLIPTLLANFFRAVSFEPLDKIRYSIFHGISYKHMVMVWSKFMGMVDQTQFLSYFSVCLITDRLYFLVFKYLSPIFRVELEVDITTS